MLWHHALPTRCITHLSCGLQTHAIKLLRGLGAIESPVTIIRSFCNADLPTMLEIWIQHWSSIGPPPIINAAKFEQAILARTFFDPSSILLATTDEGVQGWCHYAPCRTSEKTAVICAICFATACDTSARGQLLDAAQRRIAEAGFDGVRVGVVRDDQQGYAGLEPIGHGIAIPLADVRTTTLLQQSGYSPQRSVLRMAASALSYRPPVSREALQLRRTSQLRVGAYTYSDSRLASCMSHLDIEQHRLVDRSGQELARVNLWVSDPEAEVMSPSMVILDIAQAHQRGHLDPAESYLIGALVQSLAQRRIQRIETAVDSDKTELIGQLQRLHFQTHDEGVRWAKSLT